MRRRSLEVWGACDRRTDAQQQTHRAQGVQIQFQRHSRGAFTTLETVPITNARGYFDVTVSFPASGSVRLAWSSGPPSSTIYSRTQKVTVR